MQLSNDLDYELTLEYAYECGQLSAIKSQLSTLTISALSEEEKKIIDRECKNTSPTENKNVELYISKKDLNNSRLEICNKPKLAVEIGLKFKF